MSIPTQLPTIDEAMKYAEGVEVDEYTNLAELCVLRLKMEVDSLSRIRNDICKTAAEIELRMRAAEDELKQAREQEPVSPALYVAFSDDGESIVFWTRSRMHAQNQKIYTPYLSILEFYCDTLVVKESLTTKDIVFRNRDLQKPAAPAVPEEWRSALQELVSEVRSSGGLCPASVCGYVVGHNQCCRSGLMDALAAADALLATVKDSLTAQPAEEFRTSAKDSGV